MNSIIYMCMYIVCIYLIIWYKCINVNFLRELLLFVFDVMLFCFLLKNVVLNWMIIIVILDSGVYIIVIIIY